MEMDCKASEVKGTNMAMTPFTSLGNEADLIRWREDLAVPKL
jgi:hypothetical protein